MKERMSEGKRKKEKKKDSGIKVMSFMDSEIQ